jgi:hypothetical protein
MAEHHPALLDAAQDAEALSVSSLGSGAGADSGGGSAALGDPLLSFVWRVMLKRPPPEQPALEPSTSAALARFSPAATQAAGSAGSELDSHVGADLEPEVPVVAAAQTPAVVAAAPQAAADEELLETVGSRLGVTSAAATSTAQLEGALLLQHTPSPIKQSDLGAVTSSMLDIRPWQIPVGELALQLKLGAGSFCVVYRAKWHDTVVAVSVLEIARSGSPPLSPRSIAAKLSEAKRLQEWCPLMASLRHPNVVRVRL